MKTALPPGFICIAATAAQAQEMTCLYGPNGVYQGRADAVNGYGFTTGLNVRPAYSPPANAWDWPSVYITGDHSGLPNAGICGRRWQRDGVKLTATGGETPSLAPDPRPT